MLKQRSLQKLSLYMASNRSATMFFSDQPFEIIGALDCARQFAAIIVLPSLWGSSSSLRTIPILFSRTDLRLPESSTLFYPCMIRLGTSTLVPSRRHALLARMRRNVKISPARKYIMARVYFLLPFGVYHQSASIKSFTTFILTLWQWFRRPCNGWTTPSLDVAWAVSVCDPGWRHKVTETPGH